MSLFDLSIYVEPNVSVELDFLLNVPHYCPAAPFGVIIIKVLYSITEMCLPSLLIHGHN